MPSRASCGLAVSSLDTHIGQRVRVHYNLRTRRWTITGAWKGAPRTLIGHADSLTLADVTPKVSVAGMERIRRIGERSVVAWLVGTLESVDATPVPPVNGRRVSLNPKRPIDTFYHSDDMSPFVTAKRVTFTKGGEAHAE